MDTTTIKQKLHNYLEVADDKKINSIYTLLEDAIEEKQINFPDEFIAELDNRLLAFTNGNEKTVTAAESKKRIGKLIVVPSIYHHSRNPKNKFKK